MTNRRVFLEAVLHDRAGGTPMEVRLEEGKIFERPNGLNGIKCDTIAEEGTTTVRRTCYEAEFRRAIKLWDLRTPSSTYDPSEDLRTGKIKVRLRFTATINTLVNRQAGPPVEWMQSVDVTNKIEWVIYGTNPEGRCQENYRF